MFMELLESYIPQDRRVALAAGTSLPDSAYGIVLFLDVSGFTPLTEAMTYSLGIRRGAEELTRQLNHVYDAILAPVEAYGGTVIAFSGDAALCFFADERTEDGGRTTEDNSSSPSVPRPPSSVAALACAFAMQDAMQQFDAVPLPDGSTIHIGLKVTLATGRVRRMVVGDPEIRLIDTLAGETVTRTTVAEHFSAPHEIWVDEPTANALGQTIDIMEWREDAATHGRYGRLSAFHSSVTPAETFPNRALLTNEQARPWLHPVVYDWLCAQEGEFLTELRPVVALFARFGGFEYDNDAQVGGKLNQFIVRVQQLLERYQGTLLELTIGDKGSYFYAAFGAPTVHEDDPQRAVYAGQDLLTLCDELGLSQSLQIGISQGTMRVGAYGSATRRTYGAQGDEVNLAARLMMHAEPGQVLVSQRIQKNIAGEFDLEALPPLLLKGKAEPLLPFLVKGTRSGRAARMQESMYALPMIGRETELAQIEGLLTRARGGQGQIVGITAEGGMGKSRLVAEVIRGERRRGEESYIGECQSFGGSTPYLVWVSIWRTFFGLDANMPPRRLGRALEVELDDLAPGRAGSLPLLGAVLNLALPENDFTQQLEPEFRKSALEALLVECVRSAAEQARAQKHALLFVLEDAHWIDPASQALLERLAASIAELPVMILLTYRPQETSVSYDWDALPHFTQIVLNELTPAQGEGLIRAKFAQFAPENTAPIPPALISPITARAQGNPFYIEELLNYMHDRGLNLRDPAAYDRADLPNSLHRLILSRIDHLSEQQQLTLKVASVLGRTFQLAELAGYYPRLGEPEVVRNELSRLQQYDLVQRESAEPTAPYAFKHVVTQQVAYESLSYGTRTMLHEAYGHFLETQSDAAQNLDLLAYHYDHSENLPKRREYLGRAGEAAAARYANIEAIDYMTRALTLTPREQIAERCRILTVRERVYEVQGEREQQRHDLAALEELAAALNAPETRAEVMLRQGWLAQRTAAYKVSLEVAQRTIEFLNTAQLEEITRQKFLAEANALWGETIWAQGDSAAARLYVERSLDLARASHDRAGEARALDRLGTLLTNLGEPLQARDYHQAALELARALGDRRREWIAQNSLGMVAHTLGSYSTALEYYLGALNIIREIGDRRGESIVLSNIAFVYLNLGEYDQALTYADQAQGMARTIGDRSSERRVLHNLGEMFRLIGDYAQASSYTERALALARELGDKWGQELALGNLGIIALQREDAAAALDFLKEGLELSHAIQDREGTALLLTTSGEAQLLRGEPDLAQAAFLQGLDVWETLPPSPESLRIYAGLGTIALRQGGSERAKQQAELVLVYLETHPDQATEPAVRAASLACYQILKQMNDLRASPLLQTTYAALQASAEKIKDPTRRRSFLENVRVNREIREASDSIDKSSNW